MNQHQQFRGVKIWHWKCHSEKHFTVFYITNSVGYEVESRDMLMKIYVKEGKKNEEKSTVKSANFII